MSSSQTLAADISLIDALVDSGLAVTPKGQVTAGQARKLITGNAVSVNGVKIEDAEYRLTMTDALHGRYHVIQKGKKNHHLLIHAVE
jgi:tyrosyl-tRNA synthetase